MKIFDKNKDGRLDLNDLARYFSKRYSKKPLLVKMTEIYDFIDYILHDAMWLLSNLWTASEQLPSLDS